MCSFVFVHRRDPSSDESFDSYRYTVSYTSSTKIYCSSRFTVRVLRAGPIGRQDGGRERIKINMTTHNGVDLYTLQLAIDT